MRSSQTGGSNINQFARAMRNSIENPSQSKCAHNANAMNVAAEAAIKSPKINNNRRSPVSNRQRLPLSSTGFTIASNYGSQ